MKRQDEAIDQLNNLLRDELSAVASYAEALRRMATPPLLELGANLESHRRRSALLANAISALGSIADAGIVQWGAMGRTRTPMHHPIDRRVAIDDLREGENRMVAHYDSALRSIDERYRPMVVSELVPAQGLTSGRMNLLWMSGTPPLAPAR
jgi:hypothetical protein